MSRWDSAISSGAWDDLFEQAVGLVNENDGEPLEDFELAELVRNKIYEVEGIEV